MEYLQVYLRVESDVPIHILEESYENQRWNPVDGFCNKLLPTDRPFYSSQDGLTDRDFKLITLPTPAWVWDDQWHLELLCDGQHLDAEVSPFEKLPNFNRVFTFWFSTGLDVRHRFPSNLDAR